MTTVRALILAPFDESQLDRLRAVMDIAYESWLDTRRLTDPDDLADRIKAEGISILVVEADFVFEETFEGCPGLKFVGICRSATNQVDVDAATRSGVLVVNTPGRNARAVAEHALALILALSRKIPQAHQYVTTGGWQHPVGGYIDLRGVELAARTVGIIGLGAIGRSLAEMCMGLGVDVVAYDPYAVEWPKGVRMSDLHGVAKQSDFVSVHVRTTAETTGLLDADFFATMKPGAYLVSCSDYQVIDQAALLDALCTNRLLGAALDVFETQPIAPDSPLLKLDNVILTPHIGGATIETIQRHSRMMTDDILRFVKGCRPKNLVDPAAWATRQ